MITNLQDRVEVAYKKLKQMVYFERHQLKLRRRLAQFECANDFESRIKSLAGLVERDLPQESMEFQSWLDEIEFDMIPKGVDLETKHDSEKGSYVSNVTSSSSYPVSKTNYIFDGPIELHLIAVLWLMIEGYEYDRMLSGQCFGSRLHAEVDRSDDHSGHLFRKYHELYTKWRDSGIEAAEAILKKPRQGVCIVALDVQEYFYRIEIDWDILRTQIPRPVTSGPLDELFLKKELLGERLFKCLQAIFQRYRKVLTPSLRVTHPCLPPEATCLPIGLCASPVIANWYLKVLDDAILEKVRPAYYGRYVDDILIVVPMATPPDGTDPIHDFVERVLVRPGIVSWDIDQNRFELADRRGLFLQRRKCNLQFFDSEHSVAGLEKFQRQIDENASLFGLLPVDGDESPVGQVAYDLLYDGSENKLRSIKGIVENRWALAQHLAKQIQLYLMTDGELDLAMKRELFHFFKGRNAIDFWDMWERVFSFLVVANDFDGAKEFQRLVLDEVRRIQWPASNGGNEVVPRIKESLRNHAELSLELAQSILGVNAGQASALWRRSNLIRHHLVAVPLLNYTKFDGNLAFPVCASALEIDPRIANQSPRYVHFDECVGFVDSGFCLRGKSDSISEAQEIYKLIHGSSYQEIQYELFGNEESA